MTSRAYRMAPELRRSAIYGMIGCALVAAVIFGIEPLVQRGPTKHRSTI